MAAIVVTKTGFDWNMTCPEVSSPDPTAENGYATPGAGERRWTVAVQCETAVGALAAGIPNQSLPINAGGALTMEWTPRISDRGPNYRAALTMDFSAHPAPAAGTYTWFCVQDSVAHGGGPFCHPDLLLTSVQASCDWWTPSGDARFFLMAGFWWDGALHLLEINLARSATWPRKFGTYIDTASPIGGGEYVTINGAAWGLGMARRVETVIAVDWRRTIDALCGVRPSGVRLFTAPTNRAVMGVVSVGFGMEFLADDVRGSGIARMWLTDLRNEVRAVSTKRRGVEGTA
jgi:hypothetical protein